MCDSCNAVTINGTLCHERGCPDAWQDETRECFECGCDFTPKDSDDTLCPDCVDVWYMDYGWEEE